MLGSLRMKLLIGYRQCLCREFSTQASSSLSKLKVETQQLHKDLNEIKDFEPALNWEYICDQRNRNEIHHNITIRKGVGDIDKVLQLHERLKKLKADGREGGNDYRQMRRELLTAAADIPNKTHPNTPVGDEFKAKVEAVHGQIREFSFTPCTSSELGHKLNILRMQNVGLTTGARSYYLMGQLAQLSDALVRFVIDNLTNKGFRLLSIPDLISTNTVESCGFRTTGERTQVYRLTPDLGDLCLAGTAEIPIAGFLRGQVFEVSSLPLKLAAVSRCYRAEVSELEREQGLYRVHQFTKVEMFGVTSDDSGLESEALLNEIICIQTELFNKLGLHFRVLDMPSEELGAPAYRKYDMETWLPAKKFWGEISSASNCTDYQARRLGIKYRHSNSDSGSELNLRNKSGNTVGSLIGSGLNSAATRFCHTVNGTACAVPRLLISILENNQQQDGTVLIPEVLQPYMSGQILIQSTNSHRIKYQPIRLTHDYKDAIYHMREQNRTK